MCRNGLSLTTAAEVLGISRRTVTYYRTARKAIPRTVWLK
jgi:predicted transcriptional regulator